MGVVGIGEARPPSQQTSSKAVLSERRRLLEQRARQVREPSARRRSQAIRGPAAVLTTFCR